MHRNKRTVTPKRSPSDRCASASTCPPGQRIFRRTCTPQHCVVTCFSGTADDIMKCLESAHIHSAALKLRLQRAAKQVLSLQHKYTAVRKSLLVKTRQCLRVAATAACLGHDDAAAQLGVGGDRSPQLLILRRKVLAVPAPAHPQRFGGQHMCDSSLDYAPSHIKHASS